MGMADGDGMGLAAVAWVMAGALVFALGSVFFGLGAYRRSIRARSTELSELGFAMFEWDSQRQELLDVDDAVKSAVDELGHDSPEVDRTETASALHDVLSSRAQLLAE
ncbi:MAG: hypothetical protein MUQ26_00640, partial [Armatimonadetes bacterium]|nr:hypothetical protein [Armatimonadota bacterium]